MSSVLPVPTLDHVVVNVIDRLDAAADTYQRLGFTLTPRGYHTLGSMNHLAMFGTDYMELLAMQPGAASRPDIRGASQGLDGLVFATEDATATFEALRSNDVPIDPPQQFSRPVEANGEIRDAAFRTTRLPPEATPAGRVYFCQHLTRDLVWRDEWRHHANGAVGIARMVIAAEKPDLFASLFAGMFGASAVRHAEDGCSLVMGLSRCQVVTPSALWTMFGTAAPDSRGRSAYMAGLTIRTLSLEAAEGALSAGGISGAERIGTSLLVPAKETFGLTLEFSI